MESPTLKKLLEKGVLISPEINKLDEKLLEDIANYFGEDLDILDLDVVSKFKDIKRAAELGPKVKILKSYDSPPKKRTFQDFVSVFNMRFKILSQMLRNRKELQGVTAISRVIAKTTNDKVAVIGMILDKQTTKNNNIILKIEDLTGICNVIIRKDEKNKDLYDLAVNLSLDEVIGITGSWLSSAVFADRILFPDIPLNKELKKKNEEEYVVLLGDTHFGSNVFMEYEFEKFIQWIQGNAGNEEQKRMAEKTNYIILTGDIVEGVGIYPNQQNDLTILDITDQYVDAARRLKQIPERIKIIAMSGNHDAGRLSEPQETPYKDYAAAIWAMPNVTLVSNPAYVNIASTEDFPGFDILLYHGGSLIYYSQNVPFIREAGGQKRTDLILKYLLQRRHLAPTHGATLYLPDADQDFLLIDIIPDFFITGHIHRSTVGSYRNITTINSSCWTETTEDQIKRGLEPLPARVPIINLKTREVKIMNFLSKKTKEKEEEKIKQVKELSQMI